MAKKGKTRTPLSDGIERRNETSAGGIVWRRGGDGRIEIVLVRPAGKESWTLPKGQPNQGETTIETAARETREETGLEVTPGEQIGTISYVFSVREKPEQPLVRIFKRVHYFLMEPRGGDVSLHDAEMAEVRWVSLDEAEGRASYKSDREIIAKARAMLDHTP